MASRMSLFLDRLTERIMALFASAVSSRIEEFQTVTQAEQQSQLEDLARRYEADGKHDIARTLRQRALELCSNNLASRADDIVDLVTGSPPRIGGPGCDASTGLNPALPASKRAADRRSKRRRIIEADADGSCGGAES